MEMDDFDFKPITQGLGFDKKAEETTLKKTSMPSFSVGEKEEPVKPQMFEKTVDFKTPKTSRMISDMISALPPSIDFTTDIAPKKNEPKVYMPVGRADYNLPTPTIETPLPTFNEEIENAQNKVDVSLNNTLEKAFPKVGFRRPFFHQTVEVKPQYTPVTASFTSAILDMLVISGLTVLFLVSLILVTKIDLIAVLLHTKAPLSVWVEVGAIFMGVYTLYYMCTRGLWGCTLGDWAFDLQLGLDAERLNWYYPAQVIARMLAIAVTGFITLPIISFLVKQDVAYWFSGLRLYSRNY